MDDEESRGNKKKIIIDKNSISLKVNDFDDTIYDEVLKKQDETSKLTVFNLKELEEAEFKNDVELEKIQTIKDESETSSSCSSRTSNTGSKDDESLSSLDTEDLSDLDSSDFSCEEEEEIFAYIDNFPVNMICLENCSNTLDHYMVNNNVENKEWAGIFAQLIFTLLVYQKCFHFTHNDLHTNNVMYV